jgi:hypothetical protein
MAGSMVTFRQRIIFHGFSTDPTNVSAANFGLRYSLCDGGRHSILIFEEVLAESVLNGISAGNSGSVFRPNYTYPVLGQFVSESICASCQPPAHRTCWILLMSRITLQ